MSADIVYGCCPSAEGKKIYKGKENDEGIPPSACCYPDDRDCICKVDPDNVVCQTCPANSVFCDEETGVCNPVG